MQILNILLCIMLIDNYLIEKYNSIITNIKNIYYFLKKYKYFYFIILGVIHMKALMKTENGYGAELVNVEIPKINKDEVLIKIDATAICGTDGHIYKWDKWSQSRIKPPLIFGHEFCGKIVEIGNNVNSVNLGDFVSGEGHITCNNCYFCKTGQGHICQDVNIIGVDINGAFAEYLKLPARNVWKIDYDIPLEVAAIHDPFGNAVHTAMQGELTSKTVAIFGSGSIGLIAVAIAKHAGASKIFTIDVNDYKLELAKKLGADKTINARKESVVDIINNLTDGLGVDIILEMSGNQNAIKQGLQAIKKGGWVSLLGIPEDNIEIDLANDIIFKGLKIYGVNGRKIWDTWYRMSSLFKGGLDLTPVITHRFAFEDYEKAFELLLAGKTGKVILYPDRKKMPVNKN
jgi:threonine 3-dehydrogenase